MCTIIAIKKTELYNGTAIVQHMAVGATFIYRQNEIERWRDAQPNKWDFVIGTVPDIALPGDTVSLCGFNPHGYQNDITND